MGASTFCTSDTSCCWSRRASAGDRLIVGLNSDHSVRRIKGPPRPIVGQDERAQILAALSAVDAVVLFDESTPLKLIEAIRPDVLVKGGDYAEDNIAGAREVRAWGGRVEIIPLVEGVSTTRLLAKALATASAPASASGDRKLNPMLPPLLFSVRVPTLLAMAWRALLPERSSSALPRRGRLRIIIFRLDAMGDVVMTTPLFRELKRRFPNSHCTAVVQHAFRPLLVTNPFLDEMLTLPVVAAGWLPRRAKKLLAALLLYWRCLRKKRYDIAISPRWDVDEHLATMLCLLTDATERVGYSEKTSPSKQRLNRGFDAAFSLCLPAGPVQHEVKRNLAVVEALGGAVHDSRLEVRLTERDREVAARLLANVPASSKLIALGIGANSPGRCWPIGHYADTLSRLAQEFPVQPVILCSAGEREQALKLAPLLGSYENSPCEIVLGEESLGMPQLQPHRGGIGFSPGRKPWVGWENQQSPFRDGTVLTHSCWDRKAIILERRTAARGVCRARTLRPVHRQRQRDGASGRSDGLQDHRHFAPSTRRRSQPQQQPSALRSLLPGGARLATRVRIGCLYQRMPGDRTPLHYGGLG